MSAPRPDAPAKRRIWLATDLALFGAGLWLVGPLPVAEVGGLYDDYLFVRLANFLLQGRWLGPYDALTLAKGPFYPMFLAAAAVLGIPIQVATELVYLAGAAVLSRCISQLSGRPALGTTALAVLALNPACFEWSTTMLMREPLYCGLTLLVLGLAARLFLCSGGTLSALALGIAAADFWLTREEGLIMLPPVALMAAWHVRGDAVLLWAGLRGRLWPTTLPAIRQVMLPVAVASTVILAVCAINWRAYGVFRTNEFQTGPFAGAYGALSRIVPDHWQALTPISRDMRLHAYTVSSAMRELQPYIEGDAAHFTTDVACTAATRAYCHDIPGASFMWAFRDAVARAGHYSTAGDADRFYRRLAREVNAACAQKRLPCLGTRSGFLPPLGMAYLRPVLHSLRVALTDIVRLGGASPTTIFSSIQGPLTPAYDRLTVGTRVSPQQNLAFAQGWQITGALSARNPATHLAASPVPGGVAQALVQTTRDSGVAVALHRQAGDGVDFGADLRCQPAACLLDVIDDDHVLGTYPLVGARPGRWLNTADATLEIFSVSPLASSAKLETLPSLRRAVMLAICRFWPILSIGGATLAVLAFAIRIVTHWRAFVLDPLTWLSGSLLLTVVLRAVLLALVDATTTNLQFRYESPAMAALLCFIVSVLGPITFDRMSRLRRA